MEAEVDFGDVSVRLADGLVTCYSFNGTIIETGAGSYRLASAGARTEPPARAG